MRKKLISILLRLALLGTVLPVYAQETAAQLSISSAEEFLAFAENCRLDSYSKDLTVTLEKNIDLSGVEFTPIPTFSGHFDGQGHIISGLSITGDGSAQGLFRYLTATAVVENLTVSGHIQPGGSRSRIGGIAGHNLGHIRYCGFTGSVSGSNNVGGIVGINGVTGIIENCLVGGNIYGDHFVGGIAGENTGVIRSCTNQALVNTTPQQNDVAISDITMDTLTNTEAANTATDIGGIAGISSGVIRDCQNLGDVGYPHIGYNIGGIVGTQSGYVVNCVNRGNIQGRKEVGGIVGQMEPTTFIEYSEDTLQILQGQLVELSGLVNQASGNAQANATQIGSQIGVLQNQAKDAQNAVDALLPDQTDPELPDADSSLAALNTLSSTLNAMPGTLSGITAATKTTVASLSQDLNAISGQISKMGETVNSASENMGGSIVDISDVDTPELLTGKVESCTNYGTVLADLNTGGIAGAMAVENDLDILEDWQQYGEESLNFQSNLRAVILNCRNEGSLTGKKQNAGGIVGWQSLGLVMGCTNTGNLDCQGADYVGGISGLSTGYVRQNFVRCQLQASAYVGGIAGSGTVVTDCLAQIKTDGGAENAGAILGTVGNTDKETPICGNYYLPVDWDPGAIDGISYSSQAEPMGLTEFLKLENAQIFQDVTVRFVFADGTVTEITVETGGNLDPSQIPQVPAKDSSTGRWDGLTDGKLDGLLFDVTFTAVYDAYSNVLQSQDTRDNGLPILLLEGSFTDSAAIHLEASATAPVISERESLLEVWQITTAEGSTSIRFLLPDDADPGQVKLLLGNAEGQWEEVQFIQNGSYLVFPGVAKEMHLAVIAVPSYTPLWILSGAILLVLLLLIIMIIVKKKKTKSSSPAAVNNQV